MPGTFTVKLLANGQLPLTEGDLYLVPTATTAIVKLVALVNTDAVARTVNLFVKQAGGVSRRLTPVNRSMAAGDSIEVPTFGEYTLGAGDAVRGFASAAAVVDFSVHGVEET